MNQYQINHMIIDDGFNSEEYVTADVTHQNNDYSITFKKADLELINAWILKDGSSLPANLSKEMIEMIRAEIENRL